VTRVAAVDLGTNATRLLVADVDGTDVRELARRLEITRLGEGVDERRRLLPVPIARVRNVLGGYRRVAEELGAERVLAVATSSVREADNGEAFLGEIEWSYGFETLLLSGEDEAALVLRGVSVGRELGRGVLVLDVGGGSTELVEAGDGFGVSLELGGVRLTERFGDDVGGLRRALAAVLRVDTACSYDLVTQEFRQGMTREAWAAGTIPVIPFHTKLPGQTQVETLPRAADAGQRASLVLLSSPDIGGYAFEVVLVRRTGRWLVDYWNAAPPSAGLAGAS